MCVRVCTLCGQASVESGDVYIHSTVSESHLSKTISAPLCTQTPDPFHGDVTEATANQMARNEGVPDMTFGIVAREKKLN